MRLIDADALKEKAVDADYVPTWKWLSISDLESAPTIEQKNGKWSAEWSAFGVRIYCCTRCRTYSEADFPYCPWCGAKMERSE